MNFGKQIRVRVSYFSLLVLNQSTPPQCVVVSVDLGTTNMDRLMKDSQNDINGGVKLDPFSPSKKNLVSFPPELYNPILLLFTQFEL